MQYRLAPELLSHEGRVVVLVVYILMMFLAGYGCSQVKIDFKVDFFIAESAYIYEFFQLNDEVFKSGFSTTMFIDNSDLDFTSSET